MGQRQLSLPKNHPSLHYGTVILAEGLKVILPDNFTPEPPSEGPSVAREFKYHIRLLEEFLDNSREYIVVFQ